MAEAVKPGICTECGKWLCVHVDDAITAAERRGFIKGLEAALRVALRERSANQKRARISVRALGSDDVATVLRARIKREKEKR